MTRRTFQSNPNYVQLVEMLHKLHFLMRNGQDDERGDELRDAMDSLWYKLSLEEQSRLDAMSADLKTLEPDSPIRHPSSPVLRPSDFRESLAKSYSAKNWESVLSLLRERPDCISLDQATYLRSRCWEQLGDIATAKLFYVFGAQFGDNLEAAYLLFLFRNKQLEEARERVLQIANRESKPSVTLQSVMGQLLFASSRNSSETSRLNEIAAAAEILRSASLSATPDDPVPTAVLVLLGLCYHHLGKIDEAKDAYERAIAAEPGNVGVLVARGILNYGVNDDIAVPDFRKAATIGTGFVWPYAFLAHFALLRGDFGGAIEMARQALARTNIAAHRAQLLEWIGIAETALGYPWAEIRKVFQTAILLAPDNQRIYENYLRFEEAVDAAADISDMKWALPDRLNHEWTDSWLFSESSQLTPELTAA